jgi:hypothetical protein
MRKLNLILLFLYLIFQLGCGGFVINDKVTGNYSLVATDEDQQLSLCYFDDSDNNGGCVSIVTETVFAVGCNANYIIVKQHPRRFPDPPNKAITHYYILPVNPKDKKLSDYGLIGPLSLAQFNAKRKELNIPDSLRFTIVKADLQ